jgi:hypothetical protein
MVLSDYIILAKFLKNVIHVGEVCFLCDPFNISCESDIPKLYNVVFSDNFRTL